MNPELEKERPRIEHDGGGNVAEKSTVLEAYRAGKLSLPPGYELQFDADMILLRRDEATVAAFGVVDTTPSGETKPPRNTTPGPQQLRLRAAGTRRRGGLRTSATPIDKLPKLQNG